MRLGSGIPQWDSPEQWAMLHRERGLSAAYCPIKAEDDDYTINAYLKAADENNIIIAEVGAWSNLLDSDETAAKAALEHNIRQLALAERVGARCCVNISGSCGEKWDGPHPKNLTPETFGRVVELARTIIDAVRPTRTHYSYEPMPWAFPHNAQDYAELIKAIDRPAFAVHLDPINIVSSVDTYFHTGDLVRECFRVLGGHIVSCHAKDILLDTSLTVHLSEVQPGEGGFDHAAYLTELAKLGRDISLMIEHLPSQDRYEEAIDFYHGEAKRLGLAFE